MKNPKLTKTFVFGPKSSSEFKQNLEVIAEAAELSLETGSSVALIEIARNLDRIANALEEKK